MSFKLQKHELVERYMDYGYVVVPKFIQDCDYLNIVKMVWEQIHIFAADCNTNYARYLAVTGRWSDQSVLTKKVSKVLDQEIKKRLLQIFDKRFQFCKSNIIFKNCSNPAAVPFHQDISYSVDNPYSCSVWLALTQVPKNSGPLKLIPGSHKLPIRPAVDFWSPFCRNIGNIGIQDAREIILEPGDAIIFNSRVWHGSSANNNGIERMAYVSRWRDMDEKFETIPKPVPYFMGMWNCSKITMEGLNNIINLFEEDSISNLQMLLDNNICKRLGKVVLLRGLELSII